MLPLLVSLIATCLPCPANAADAEPAPRRITISTAPMPRRVERDRLGTYVGIVVAIDTKSITIRGSEGGGDKDPVITTQFPLGKHLIEGERDPRELDSCCYRLSDVRIGDKVLIKLHDIHNVDVCVTISIRRRPGGVVPPAPWDKRFENRPMHHEFMNAYQQLEENGIPLPPELDPVIQRHLFKVRRQELEKQLRQQSAILQRKKTRDHTAPMPREVKR